METSAVNFVYTRIVINFLEHPIIHTFQTELSSNMLMLPGFSFSELLDLYFCIDDPVMPKKSDVSFITMGVV